MQQGWKPEGSRIRQPCGRYDGAGDSFWGAFVSQLVRADKRLEEFSIDELAECARYGNAVASLCVEKRGGLRSIPEESETFERLAVK